MYDNTARYFSVGVRDACMATRRTGNMHSGHGHKQEGKEEEAGADKHIRMLDRARCLMANAGFNAAATCAEVSGSADHASAGIPRSVTVYIVYSLHNVVDVEIDLG